jgi:tetratricopeptide (TPR) repeat protein
MDASTVALWTLAALAALDLPPATSEKSPPASKSQPSVKPLAHTTPAATQTEAFAALTSVSVSRSETAPPEVSATPALATRFTDMDGHWAQPFVEILQAKGIVRGFDDGQFRPDAAIAPEHLQAIVETAMAQHGGDLWLSYAQGLLSDAKPLPLPTLLAADLSVEGLRALRQSLPPQISQVPESSNDRLTPPKPSSLQTAPLTRAEATLFVYQALAQAGVVPPPKMPEPPPENPNRLKEANITQSTAESSGASIAEPESSTQPQPAGEIAQRYRLRPDQPASSAPAPAPVTLPAIPTPAPTPPPVDPSAPADSGVSQPTPIHSNLENLVTGDRSQNFNEYWYSLCVNHPAELAKALAACDQILTAKPKEAAIWAMRGNLLMQAKNYTEALASYDRALALATPTAEIHTRRCQVLSALNQQEQALLACDAAIALDQNWGILTPAIAWFAKGTALKRLGRNQEALAAYQRALVFNPNSSEIWTEQCRVQSELGDQAAALAICDRALDLNQAWGDRSPAIAWLNRALVLTRQEKLNEAISAYDRALELNPKDAATWTKQGQLLARLGNHADALAAYDQALKVSPNFALALVLRGAALNRLGNHAEALTVCDQAIGGDGRWGDLGVAYAWDQRGVALAGTGRFEEAIASADRAIALKPDFAEAYSNRAVTLWRMEDFAQALATVEKAVTIKPDYSQGWFNKGRILRSMKQYEAAIAAYDQALKGDVNQNDKPTLADIWVNRSATLWQMGQYEEALDSADRAVAIDPKSAIGWYNRGVALLALKQPAEAIKSYQRATQINAKDAFAWTGQGIALQQVKKYEAAIAALDKALQLNPDLSLAQQAREAVLKQLEPAKPEKVKGV